MKKITIIGPESTGKSTLCEQLATHYGTSWVPEYAREYLIKHGMDYTYNDLLTIAKGQLQLEDKIVGESLKSFGTNHQSIFIDTDMYVMKVWCEFVFEKCHQFILDQIVERKYDLYLLCNIDLPWTYDPLREYPNEEPRKRLFRIYHDIVINQSIPWVLIRGDSDERLDTAIAAIKNIL
jgi:NadR type nicotinamide-nucleotide adenylyltransferase